jgi:ADP-glucose pyrophosphorylase
VAVLAHFNGRQPPLSLPARSINRLQSLQAYHQANMDVLHGRFVHLKAAGVELADGLYAEPGAKILKRSTDDCRIFIGNSSRLPADTEIEGAASIGNQVLIDRKVKMSNTVILPHTYLGAFTNLREAIVWGKVLIRIDTGVITQVEDTQLLADITPRNRRKKSGRCQSTRLFPNGFMRRVSKKLSSYVR